MKIRKLVPLAATLYFAASLHPLSWASSHMDAPLITLDPAANTTDVYAFVGGAGASKHLTVALGVYPHQEPGIGPNKYNFDDNVLYEIHVALGADVKAGQPTLSYQFQFKTAYRNQGTILQSYLGVVDHVAGPNQNLVQTYTVTKVDHRNGGKDTVLGNGVVPPNNQGIATPFYNQGDNGANPAKDGVSSFAQLDRYTQEGIIDLGSGYVSFAGQRDDGFYGDIQSIFDLLQLRSPGKDSQGGYNLHLMALRIPLSDLGGDRQVAGVYATTSRRQVRILREDDDQNSGKWAQVARQGNPLFNEGLVAIVDKDRYSRSSPSQDAALFAKYALNPELAKLINAIVFNGAGSPPAVETNRADIEAIYIPDLIKVDLSSSAARLAGSGPGHPMNPDDAGFSRLSIFGGDVLESPVAGHAFRLPGTAIGADASKFYVPGGWPNGRRFGDDVVDIAVTALISDLRTLPLFIRVADGIDGVSKNDVGYNKTFPYEGTPQNGRNHSHP